MFLFLNVKMRPRVSTKKEETAEKKKRGKGNFPRSFLHIESGDKKEETQRNIQWF